MILFVSYSSNTDTPTAVSSTVAVVISSVDSTKARTYLALIRI